MTLALLAIPVAPVLGAWLHELTHAAAARALGGTVLRIDLWQLVVEFQGLDERERGLVRWMPWIIGALLVLWWPRPVPRPWWPAVGLWWATYTLLGGEGEPGIPFVLRRLRRRRSA